jgi:hypothetical protein
VFFVDIRRAVTHFKLQLSTSHAHLAIDNSIDGMVKMLELLKMTCLHIFIHKMN